MGMGVRLLLVSAGLALLAWALLEALVGGRGGPPRLPRSAAAGEDHAFFLDETDRGLIWFVHVSDLHVNKYPKHGNRSRTFERFARTVPPAVKPWFFIATGDLTDAKDLTRLRSGQYLEEWQSYHSVLEENGLLEPGYFNEVRGNHDCFNVPSVQSSSNYFAKYSSAKRPSYSFTVQASFGNYSFVALDGCPSPGVSRPFNFFGSVSQEELDRLGETLSHIRQEGGHNHTIVFGHYPLVTLTSSLTTTAGGPTSGPASSLSDLTSSISVYLCGHLHNLMGRAHRIYAHHIRGFLELEVADLGWSRKYRVMAIDSDLISFQDVELDQWPVIVVTNPKDARMALPTWEPLHRMQLSSHLRFLIMSPNNITNVHVEIDGERHPEPVQRALHLSEHQTAAPLFVSRWDATKYAAGLHRLRVTARDSEGNTATVEHEFSLDGTTAPLLTLGGLLLRLDFQKAIKTLFLAAHLTVLVGFLLLPQCFTFLLIRTKGSEGYSRWRQDLIRAYSLEGPASSVLRHPLSSAARLAVSYAVRFCDLTLSKEAFWPLVAYGLYVLVGPWFVGRMIQGPESALGFFYLSGIQINSTFVDTLEGWWYGIFDIVQVYLPLTLCLAHRHSPLESPGGRRTGLNLFTLLRLWTLLGLLNMYKASRELVLCYDAVALVSPAKLWWALVATFLVLRRGARPHPLCAKVRE